MDHEKLGYAFGHLVGAQHPHAHSGDSAELAHDVFEEMGLSRETVEAIEILAEVVAFKYAYTGS
jgi:hypothetical protein